MEAKDLLAGMIRRPLYVVQSFPKEGATAPQGESLFLEHLQHLIAWEKSGKLFAAGPYLQNGQITPRSMYILRAESLEEARALTAEEPMHKNGVRDFTVEEWVLNEGRVNVSIDFSTQRGGLDEPLDRTSDEAAGN